MKRLGKIASVKFGAGGYQDAMFGLTVGLEFDHGDSCVDFKGGYLPDSPDSETIFVCRILEVADILKQAKVDDIGRLRGIPIEAEFDGNALKSWRVLTEVL